jgi:hypothetical protein
MRNGVFPWIFAGLVLFSAGAAAAQENPQLDRILPGIRERHPGKFYDADGPYRGPDGQMRYRLKWMTPEGRIIWFDADARTGRVLGQGPDVRPDMRPRFDRREERLREERRDERRFERGDGPRFHGGGGRPRRGRQ